VQIIYVQTWRELHKYQKWIPVPVQSRFLWNQLREYVIYMTAILIDKVNNQVRKIDCFNNSTRSTLCVILEADGSDKCIFQITVKIVSVIYIASHMHARAYIDNNLNYLAHIMYCMIA